MQSLMKLLKSLESVDTQGNARRLLDKRCDENSRFGQLSKSGLAPVLWCIIFILLVVYTHSVIMGTISSFFALNL